MDSDREYIIWQVIGFNRATRSRFERELFLDVTALPEADREQVREAASSRGRAILKYRSLFTEISKDEVNQRLKNATNMHAIAVPDYFEDENGQPLTTFGAMKIVTGRDDIIVLNDLESVLSRGPCAMQAPERWSDEKSNDIDHFLEIVNCIANSAWIRTGVRLKWTVDGAGKRKLLEFDQPDVFTLTAVVSFLRQLSSPGDRFFGKAVDAYLEHVGDAAKRYWMQNVQSQFERLLSSSPHFIGVSVETRELIDLFWYGLGLIHRDREQKAQRFRDLLSQHGRELVITAFHQACQLVFFHSAQAAKVIQQDVQHWITSGKCSAPRRIAIRDILG